MTITDVNKSQMNLLDGSAISIMTSGINNEDWGEASVNYRSPSKESEIN